MSFRSRSLLVMAILLIASSASAVLSGQSLFVQEGEELYQQLCSRCHGDVKDSAKSGRSMNRIRSALRTFEQHRPLASLPDEQILLIAMALREGEN